MVKLICPSDGIYNSSVDQIQSCINTLSRVANNCYFDIPGGFSQGGYLRGLSGVLNGYANQARAIDAKLKMSNNYYENLENDLQADVKNMEITKLEARDRMII